jgi:hypothetical protein
MELTFQVASFTRWLCQRARDLTQWFLVSPWRYAQLGPAPVPGSGAAAPGV